MIVFDCSCKWRFIVGKKQVYGPIYPIGLPGHFTGQHGCHSLGRMMAREQFEDDYSDCAYRFGMLRAPGAPTRGAFDLSGLPDYVAGSDHWWKTRMANAPKACNREQEIHVAVAGSDRCECRAWPI